MLWAGVLCVLCGLIWASSAASSRPHIIVIVADDLGWNDVSYHGSEQIPTPNIDALATSGIILDNYYVEMLCTPSRTALLTGRYPIHTGMQIYVIPGRSPYGLGLNETILPQYLQQLDYSTHLVGKWHLGYYAKEYTPIYRGFDSQFCLFNARADYWNHEFETEYRGIPYFGLDLHDGNEVVWNEAGHYATQLFSSKAEEVIMNHDPDKPMFLYLGHQAVHAGNPSDPLQAPARYQQQFSHITDKRRRTFAGMVAELDESIGNVTRALHETGMLQNSIIVFTTDNGGAAAGLNGNCGNNWPLRGMKKTVFEGGVRGVGFVWSPLLAPPPYTSSTLMHISDWLPSLLHAAGYDMSSLPADLDGHDMWPAWNSGGESNVRTEILHNIDHINDKTALRVKDMKVVIGTFKDVTGWYPPTCDPQQEYNDVKDERAPYEFFHSELPNILSKYCHMPPQSNVPVVIDCGPRPTDATACQPNISPCLFNITADPCEFNNLAQSQPAVLTEMLERLAEYDATGILPRFRLEVREALPVFHNYTFVPWVEL